MSTIIDFKLMANANFAPVYAELARLKASMTSLSQSTLTSGITKDMTAGLKAAESQMLRNISSIRGFQTETVKLSSATDRLTKSLVQSKFSLGQYMSMWAKQKAIIPELNAIAEAQARVAQSLAIPSATRQGMAHVVTSLNGMKNATLQTKIYQQALNTALRDGATSLINFGKNTQWAGRQLTAGFTMPLTIAAGLISKLFYDVDKNLTRLARVYGTGLAKPTEAALKSIKDQIMGVSKELSRTLGISAKEVTDTAAELAAAGLVGKNLIEATKQASRIVVLGEADKQEAVKATIALQTAYKLNTQDLTEAVNFFNAAQAATSTNMQDLIEAVPRVGPVVRGLGGTYKDMVSLLTAMKEGGVPAGEAANAIKNSLARIINPTEAAQKRLKAFGIDIKDIVAKNAGNLTGTIVNLQKELDGLSSTQRQQAIAELFGKYQFARMTALMDNFGKAGTQSAKVIEMMGLSAVNLADIADEQTKKIQQSASGKFKIAIESIKTELIPIGEQFLKVFTFIIDKVDSVIKFFNKLGPMKNVILSVLGGAAIVGPITMVIGLFANLAGQILKSINNIRMFKQGFTSAIGQGPFAAITAGIKNLNNYFIQIDKAQLASKALSGEVHGMVVREEQAIASLSKTIAMYRAEVEKLIATQTGARVTGAMPFFPTTAPITPGAVVGATGQFTSPLVTNISSRTRSRKGFESGGRNVEMLHYSPYSQTALGTDILGQGGGYQQRNALGAAAIFPAIMTRQGSDIQALNQLIGERQQPTLSPRLMTDPNLHAVMTSYGIPINPANLAASRTAFSLPTIASHETGRLSTLGAMGALSTGQLSQLKSIASAPGAGAAQIQAYLKQALGPEYAKLQTGVARQVIGLYEVAEREVLAHPKFNRADIATQVQAISARYGELLREQYVTAFQALDQDLVRAIMVNIDVPLEQAGKTILEAGRKNNVPRIANMVSSAQESANLIIRAFEELGARLAAGATSIAATTSRGVIPLGAGRLGAMQRMGAVSRGPFMFNSGGKVSGPGGPTDDKIPAMLSDGEYVIKASSVNKYGTGFFDSINAQRFNGGGSVKSWNPKELYGMSRGENLLFNLLSNKSGKGKILRELILSQMINNGVSPTTIDRVELGMLSNRNPTLKRDQQALGSAIKELISGNQLKGLGLSKAAKSWLLATAYLPDLRIGSSKSFSDIESSLRTIITKKEELGAGYRRMPSRFKSARMESFYSGFGRSDIGSLISSIPYGFRRGIGSSLINRAFYEMHGTHGFRYANGGPIHAAGGMLFGGKSVLQVMQEREAREAVMRAMLPEAALVRGSINVDIFKNAWKQVDWNRIRDPEAFIQSKYREMLIHPKSAARQGFFDPYSPMTPQFAKKIEDMEIERGVQALMDEPMMAAFRAREAKGKEQMDFWISMMGQENYQALSAIEMRNQRDQWQRRYLQGKGYNSGGKVFGAGGPVDDKIPAYLSNGEYVVKADSVSKYGVGFMDALNAGKFAKGGIAGYAEGSPGGIGRALGDGFLRTLSRAEISFRSMAKSVADFQFGMGNATRLMKESNMIMYSNNREARRARGRSITSSIFGSDAFSREVRRMEKENRSSGAAYTPPKTTVLPSLLGPMPKMPGKDWIFSRTGTQDLPATTGTALVKYDPEFAARQMAAQQKAPRFQGMKNFFARRDNVNPAAQMGMMMGMPMLGMMGAGMIHGEGEGSQLARTGLQTAGTAGMMASFIPRIASMGIGPQMAVIAGISALAVGINFLANRAKEARERLKDTNAVFKESFTIPKEEAAALGIKLKDLSKVINYTGKDAEKAKTAVDMYAQSILQQAESSDSMKRFLKVIKESKGDSEKINQILNDRYQTEIMLGQTIQESTTHVLAFAKAAGVTFNASSLNTISMKQMLGTQNNKRLGAFVGSALQNPNLSTDQLQALFKAGGLEQRQAFVPELIKSLKDVVAPETYATLAANQGAITGSNAYRLSAGVEQMQAGFLSENQFIKFMKDANYAADAMKIFAERQKSITDLNADLQKQINKLSGVTSLEDQKSAKEKLIKAHEQEIKANNKKIAQEQKILQARNKEYEAINKSIEQQQEVNKLDADIVKAKAGGNLIDIALAEQSKISGLSRIDRERTKEAADEKNNAVVEKLTKRNETLTDSIDTLNEQIKKIDEKISKGVETGNKKVEEAIKNLRDIQFLASAGALTPESFKKWKSGNDNKGTAEEYLTSLGIGTQGINLKSISSVLDSASAPKIPKKEDKKQEPKAFMTLDADGFPKDYYVYKDKAYYKAVYNEQTGKVKIKGKALPVGEIPIKELEVAPVAIEKRTGGFISGPGGPTSDMIPAMLSNGEYVVRASSVAQYGTKFMDAINNGNFGYAMGGMAPKNFSVPTMNTAISAFADGGLAEGGSYNVSIVVNASTTSSADEIASAIKKEFDKINVRKQMMSTSRTVSI